MPETAEYVLLQYVANPLRQEARNIGVAVRKGQHYALRFYAESGTGIDGRKLRGVADAGVYRQWVEYWRRCVSQEADPFQAILGTARPNYQALRGGDVFQTEDDPVEAVADYLYTVLVDQGGIDAVLAAEEAAAEEGIARVAPAPRFDRELVDAFQGASILASLETAELPLVRHPVRHRAPLRGTISVPHRPEFVQENGHLVVMEGLDFTVRAKEHPRDHAGLTAFMFQDLREARGSRAVESIAIVRVNPADLGDEPVSYGLSLLRKSGRVVDWTTEGKEFMEERRQFALSI